MPGGGEPGRRADAVDEIELPEARHEPGRRDGAREHERARGEHQARAEAVHEPADEGLERAVEEEAQRDHEREARAVQAEVGDDGLEERADGETDAGGEEHHHREREDDPPAVEDAPGHGRSHYSRRITLVQSLA